MSMPTSAGLWHSWDVIKNNPAVPLGAGVRWAGAGGRGMWQRSPAAPVRLDAGPAAAAQLTRFTSASAACPRPDWSRCRPGQRTSKGGRGSQRRCSGPAPRDAQPGYGGAGLGQLPHRRRRRAAVVAAPGARRQPAHRVRSSARASPSGSGADRRARPGDGDPAAPVAGHGQHPDGAPGRLRRHVLYLGRGQARRSRRRRARRIPRRRGRSTRPGAGDERIPRPGAGLLRPARAAAVPVLHPAGVLRPRRQLAARPARGPRPAGGPVRRVRGTQAVLLLASYLPHLADAVVASSPTDVVDGATGGTGPGWTFGGKPLAARHADPGHQDPRPAADRRRRPGRRLGFRRSRPPPSRAR